VTQPGQLAQTDPRDNPYHIPSCSAIKPGGEFFQRSHCLETGWASVCLWEVVSNCPCITCSGKGLVLCWFFFFLFAPSIKLSLSRPKRFSRFCPSSSLPYPAVGAASEQLSRAELPAGVSPPHLFTLEELCINRLLYSELVLGVLNIESTDQIKMKLLLPSSSASAMFLSKRKQKI